MKSAFVSTISKVSWYLLVLSLPFTSFSLISRIFGGTSVAPLSLFFLIISFAIALLPQLIKTRSLPSQVILLLLFVVSALVSSALGNFIFIPSYRDAPVLKSTIEGIVTLATGISFFIVTILMNKDEKSIITSVKIINISGLVIILYALLQAGFWQLTNKYPTILYNFQEIITINGRLYPGRVNAMAYEPSWLAHQLNLLYIPLWLGFSSQHFSVYQRKLFNRVSFEFILLVFGVLVIFLSLSRIGWLTALTLAVVILVQKINRAYNNYNLKRSRKVRWTKRLLFWFVVFLSLMIIVGIIGYIFTLIDPRMAKLFNFYQYIGKGLPGLIGWASLLGIGERIAYWSIGYRVYSLHPFMGIGLGSTGKFFGSLIPEFAFRLPEVVRAYISGSTPPNPKSLWIRLLAETGIVGFTFFTAWIYQHALYAKGLIHTEDNQLTKVMGIFGILAIIALLFEGFSLDTFGLPYYWIALGLIASVYRSKKKNDPG